MRQGEDGAAAVGEESAPEQEEHYHGEHAEHERQGVPGHVDVRLGARTLRSEQSHTSNHRVIKSNLIMWGPQELRAESAWARLD